MHSARDARPCSLRSYTGCSLCSFQPDSTLLRSVSVVTVSLATGLGVIEIALRNGRIVPAATVATGTEANNMLDSFIVFLVLVFCLKKKYVGVF